MASYPHLTSEPPDPVATTGHALIDAARTVLGLIALPGKRDILAEAADAHEEALRENGVRT